MLILVTHSDGTASQHITSHRFTWFHKLWYNITYHGISRHNVRTLRSVQQGAPHSVGAARTMPLRALLRPAEVKAAARILSQLRCTANVRNARYKHFFLSFVSCSPLYLASSLFLHYLNAFPFHPTTSMIDSHSNTYLYYSLLYRFLL